MYAWSKMSNYDVIRADVTKVDEFFYFQVKLRIRRGVKRWKPFFWKPSCRTLKDILVHPRPEPYFFFKKTNPLIYFCIFFAKYADFQVTQTFYSCSKSYHFRFSFFDCKTLITFRKKIIWWHFVFVQLEISFLRFSFSFSFRQ